MTVDGHGSNSLMRHFLDQASDSSSPNLPLSEQGSWTASSPRATFSLQYADAIYLQHFASELGRWLDCTDAARQFTVKIPHLAQEEEILMRAVACFAARHMGQPNAAAQAHKQCVRLLIPRLTAADVASDDAVLCAIVILRVFEQLDGKCTDHSIGTHPLTKSCQSRKVARIRKTISLAARHCCNPRSVCRLTSMPLSSRMPPSGYTFGKPCTMLASINIHRTWI